jgi:hypothetical protein
MVSPKPYFINFDDDEEAFSYDSKLLKTETEETHAFLEKSIGKHY